MLDNNSFIVNVDDIPVQDQELIGAIAYEKVMAN